MAQIDETALHAGEIAQAVPPHKSAPGFSAAALDLSGHLEEKMCSQ